jgi:hypothetical protein
MPNDKAAVSRWRRGIVQTAIGALGVAAIVGSGGGFPDLGDCPFPGGCGGGGPLPPFVSIDRGRVTAQVGATVVLTARVTNAPNPTYSWCRQPGVSSVCNPIPGASGASLTIAGVNLADDGTLFTVTVADTNGSARASSALAVSSMPGMAYQDSEFAVLDWAVTAIADPPQNGPTHAESQPTTGGNPGAYRLMSYDMSAGASSIQVQHVAQGALYDPAGQGAVYTIDFAADCIDSSPPATTALATIAPLFEQGTRRYGPASMSFTLYCASPTWQTGIVRWSMGADDFVIVDGPACGNTEHCPDFSVAGAPIRLGYLATAKLEAGVPAGMIAHGIDNWKVTVWRH